MQRNTDQSNISALEFATQCISMGENLRFSRDALRQAFGQILEAPAQPKTTPVSKNDIRAQWQTFYKEHFGMNVDFSGVVIPDHQEGFDRILIIAKGLTINQVIEACRKHFKVWTYTEDLDKAVTKNDRSPAEASYAIRIRDRVEADEELKNKSANQLAEEDINGITLLERLVLELFYFIETGNNLDIDKITLCSGSRDSGGHVPNVYWDDVGLDVGWCGPSHVNDDRRSRAVVS